MKKFSLWILAISILIFNQNQRLLSSDEDHSFKSMSSVSSVSSAFSLLKNHSGFMPKNDLHLQDHLQTLGLTEKQFQDVLDLVERVYAPIIKTLGGELQVNRQWTNTTVNASANQIGKIWHLNMYGGLARRNEVTVDGFTLVACHELGHHLAGVPFYGPTNWAASEGQSDYFSTLACGKFLWKNDLAENARAREMIESFAGGVELKHKCDKVYKKIPDQNLCYRLSIGGKSLGDLLAALGQRSAPQFNTPDPSKVVKTYLPHPQAQCRLDTYTAGALCDVDWDHYLIPGKKFNNRTSFQAFIESAKYACHEYLQKIGERPRCWFNAEDVLLPEIKIDLLQASAAVKKEQEVYFSSIKVMENDIVKMTMSGDGDADLYVRYNKKPTMSEYDCRPMKYGSEEVCQLTIPTGASQIFAMVKGWSNLSQVKITAALNARAKLCRNFNGGYGEKFDCFGEYQCRMTSEDADRSNQSQYCIIY